MGRRLLGAAAGLLLGAFLAFDLHMLGVWSLSKTSEVVLMAAGLLVGVALARRPKRVEQQVQPVP